jgi:hypothetical protein
MSFTRRVTAGLFATAAATLLALASIALPVIATAQGGGMGGFGSPGGMPGRGRGGFGKSHNSSAPDVAKHFEEMASLKAALKHVDGLTNDQKLSVADIERGYGKSFKELGHEAQQLVDSGHAAHGSPDRARMDSLRQKAKRQRDEELAAARNILSTDPQRDQFDRNLAQLREEEAKREEDPK